MNRSRLDKLLPYTTKSTLHELFIATQQKGGKKSALQTFHRLHLKAHCFKSFIYSSPRQTIFPSFTINSSSKVMVGLYCTISICTVERAG